MKRLGTAALVAMMILTGAYILFETSNDAEADLYDDSILVDRSPIKVDGNSAFTSANGVTSGSGIESDPYLIENLRIDASEDTGVSLSDLRKRSGLKRESFQYNLKKLRRMKLVWRVGGGIHGFGYEVITRERLADEMFLLTVNKFLGGRIEKDEMMSIIDNLVEYREEDG